MNLVVLNTGFSPAQNIRVNSISPKFRLDEGESQISQRLLGVQQDKSLRLLLLPRPDVLGMVLLQVNVLYEDPQGGEHQSIFEQTVKVFGRDEKLRAAEGLPDEATPLTGAEAMNISRLRRGLIEYFNEDELESLCFDLQVDHESLPGETKAGKARELIRYLGRRGRLRELEDMVHQLRPNVNW